MFFLLFSLSHLANYKVVLINLFQVGELGRLSASMKKLEKDLKKSDKNNV